LTTLAGRSITSPAAIIFTIFWSRTAIRPIIFSGGAEERSPAITPDFYPEFVFVVIAQKACAFKS
jgi:hypothetical protein